MKRPHLILIALILLISLFFRTYQIVSRFDYAHDGDLYSWIVKDIVVNKDLRLIGQLTSAPGIYIGPIFYYLLIPFFLLFNMDPVGIVIPITIFGILTTLSYYFIFAKLFNKYAGFFAAFIQSVSLFSVDFDRRNVPSTPTNLWTIWYFYTIISISRGNYSVLPILGILIGLVWHLHIALAPALLAIPAAMLISRKFPRPLEIIHFLVALILTSIPLIIFEVRNSFPQTLSLVQNFLISHEGGAGEWKLQMVLNMIGKNINALLLSPQSLPSASYPFLLFALLLLFIPLFSKRIISAKEIIPQLVWIFGVVAFFSISSSLISEYYFYNIQVIFIALVSLTLYLLYKSSTKWHFAVICLLILIFLKNLYFFTTSYIYHKGYAERKAVANYITMDAKNKGFPCIGINYITSPGENVGFRYFFYLNNQHLVPPSNNVPVYSIVIPDEYALKEVEVKYGHIGIITPKKIQPKEVMDYHCSGGNSNLTDPMFGYVE